MKKRGKVILGISIAIIGLCIFASGVSNFSTAPTANQNEQKTEKETKGNYATLEKFNQIETGMTYEEVVSIVGCEGTVASESEVSGIKTTIYYWYAEDGISNMNIIVQDGSVYAKAQVGLK